MWRDVGKVKDNLYPQLRKKHCEKPSKGTWFNLHKILKSQKFRRTIEFAAILRIAL